MATSTILLIVGLSCLIIGLAALFVNFFNIVKTPSLDSFQSGILRHVIVGAWCVGSSLLTLVGLIMAIIDYAKK